MLRHCVTIGAIVLVLVAVQLAIRPLANTAQGDEAGKILGLLGENAFGARIAGAWVLRPGIPGAFEPTVAVITRDGGFVTKSAGDLGVSLLDTGQIGGWELVDRRSRTIRSSAIIFSHDRDTSIEGAGSLQVVANPRAELSFSQDFDTGDGVATAFRYGPEEDFTVEGGTVVGEVPFTLERFDVLPRP